MSILDGVGEIGAWLGSAKDVTAHKRTEDDLRHSDEMLRIAIEGARMGTWRWDLKERLVGGDAELLALWGFPPSNEPHSLSRLTDRMTPQGQSEMSVLVMRAIEACGEFDGILSIVDGPTAGRWVRWRGRAEQGDTSILHGVSFNVIERGRKKPTSDEAR